VHGDLGALRKGDVVIAISHSGKTAELVTTLPGHLEARGVHLLAICNSEESPLGVAATEVCVAPASQELLGSVPSRSIIAQEAVCTAITSALVDIRGYKEADFGFNHPGGAIGVKLG
jgi:arabinose-5-phosphate isomerase